MPAQQAGNEAMIGLIGLTGLVRLVRLIRLVIRLTIYLIIRLIVGT